MDEAGKVLVGTGLKIDSGYMCSLDRIYDSSSCWGRFRPIWAL